MVFLVNTEKSHFCVRPWLVLLLVAETKRQSMLTGLKVSSLACNCVFYRPEHNAKRRPHEIYF